VTALSRLNLAVRTGEIPGFLLSNGVGPSWHWRFWGWTPLPLRAFEDSPWG
jgi:hypothetical protein